MGVALYEDKITDYYEDFLYHKFRILSPHGFEISDDSSGFIRLKGDIGTTISEIEGNHLKAIKKSEFLIVINPKSYIGISTALEIGYAVENRKPIFFSDGIPHFMYSEPDRRYPVFSFNHDIELLIALLRKRYRITNFFKKPNSPQLKKYYLIDNCSKSISVPLAYFIGKMVALKIKIIYKKPPIDILLNSFFNSNLKNHHFFSSNSNLKQLSRVNIPHQICVKI